MGSDRALRVTAAVWAVTILVHTADHVRRGLDASPGVVIALGAAAFVLQGVAVAAALLRHRLAPLLAVAIALPDSIGVVAVHLAPRWSFLSDSFPSNAPGTTAFSWVTALAEVAAGLEFAYAGWLAMTKARSPEGDRASYAS